MKKSICIKETTTGCFWTFYKKYEIFIDEEEDLFYYRIHQPNGFLLEDGWKQTFDETFNYCLGIIKEK